MPIKRNKKTGEVWLFDDNGNPVRRIDAPSPPQQGAIPIGPRNTDRARQAQNDAISQANDAERLRLAQDAEYRSQRTEARTIDSNKFEQEGKLRDDFNQNAEVKAYRASLPMLAQAINAPKNGQGDLSVIYAYAKLMDPGSVVREGEMDMVVNSSPYAQATAQKFINQLDGSGRLPDKTRRSLEQEMIRVTRSRRKSYETQYNRYRDNASGMGLDPNMVVGPHEGDAFRADMQAYDRERGLGRFADQKRDNPFSGLPGKSQDTGNEGIGPDPRFEGQTFNELGQPDPDGLYDAYGRALPDSIIAPTSDRHRNPDGSWVGDSGLVHDEWGNIIQGWKGPAHGSYADTLKEQVQQQTGDPNSAQNWIMRAANGALFNFSDEVNGAKAAGKAIFNGNDPRTSYVLGRDLERMRQQLNQEGQGGLGTALEITSSIPSSLALPFGRVNNIRDAMKAGTVIGAVDGAGRGNGASGTALSMSGGALGGMLGGGVAGAAGKHIIAPAASKVLQSRLGQSISQKLADAMGKKANPLPKLLPEEAVINKTGADIGRVRGNISEAESLGMPYSLADADPRLRMLGGTISRQSPEAYTVAENYLGPRGLGQIDRLKGELDRLAPITNVSERGGQLLKAGNINASPYYEMANSADVPISAELSAMLNTKIGKDAAKRSASIMEGELGAKLPASAEQSFRSLDYIKKGLDARIEDFRNPVTGVLDIAGNPEVRALDTFRKNLVSKLDDINPAYKQGRAEYAKFAQRKDALDTGYSLPGMLPRDADTFVARLTPDTMPEAQRGFSTALADKAEKLRYSANPYEAIYGSPAQQQRIASMFPEGADRFGKVFNREREMTKTMHEILGGSPTALRQGMDKALAPQLATTAEIFGQANGVPGAGVATIKGLNFLARRGLDKAAKKNAEQLAPVLFANTADINAAGLIDALLAKNARMSDFTNNVAKRVGLFGAILAPSSAPAF